MGQQVAGAAISPDHPQHAAVVAVAVADNVDQLELQLPQPRLQLLVVEPLGLLLQGGRDGLIQLQLLPPPSRLLQRQRQFVGRRVDPVRFLFGFVNADHVAVVIDQDLLLGVGQGTGPRPVHLPGELGERGVRFGQDRDQRHVDPVRHEPGDLGRGEADLLATGGPGDQPAVLDQTADDQVRCPRLVRRGPHENQPTQPVGQQPRRQQRPPVAVVHPDLGKEQRVARAAQGQHAVPGPDPVLLRDARQVQHRLAAGQVGEDVGEQHQAAHLPGQVGGPPGVHRPERRDPVAAQPGHLTVRGDRVQPQHRCSAVDPEPEQIGDLAGGHRPERGVRTAAVRRDRYHGGIRRLRIQEHLVRLAVQVRPGVRPGQPGAEVTGHGVAQQRQAAGASPQRRHGLGGRREPPGGLVATTPGRGCTAPATTARRCGASAPSRPSLRRVRPTRLVQIHRIRARVGGGGRSG